MRKLDLNMQYIIGENYDNRLQECVKKILSEQPDTFSLKDASQSLTAPKLLMTDNLGYVPRLEEHVRIRLDNPALSVAAMLRKSGFLYKWTWIPSKDDHGQFEKGIAVFCRDSFSGAEQFFFEQEEQIKENVYE
jgi:hypothetical protein